MRSHAILFATAVWATPVLLHAQFDFKVAGRNVQVHSFASQGFAYSNNNNFLTMDTSKGSAAFTDFGVNASTQLTDRLRVGAQFYDWNLGRLGNWRPEVDWALADYRFADWFGVRGGKVKTVVGLYNDSQDLEFLHPWALLPQSMYPLDVRGDTISHVGGDLYGSIGMKKAGALNYTVWGGKRPNDPEGGLVYAIETSTLVKGEYVVSQSKKLDSSGGTAYGADLRWNTPLKGLMVGASAMRQDITAEGYYLSGHVPYVMVTVKDPTVATYAQFTAGRLQIDAEYRKENRDTVFTAATGAFNPPTLRNSRAGYLAASYRLCDRLEVGTYHSRFILNWDQNHGDPRNHLFDQAITANIQLQRAVDLKVEGHFMDGAMMNSVLNRGFYALPNPGGVKPTMNMIVVRLGYHL